MNYIKVAFHTIPYVSFAHNFETEHYNLHFPPLPNCIEIAYLEQGDVIRSYEDGSSKVYPAPSIVVLTYDRAYRMSTCCDAIHRHSTLGIISEFKLQMLSASEVIKCSHHDMMDKEEGNFSAILPECFPVEASSKTLIHIIQKIIRSRAAEENSRNILCTGLLFELLAAMTQEAVRTAFINGQANVSPGSLVYCRKARQYISAHLDKRISVYDIADHLDVSAGYISTIFKSVTGQTIVEYINSVKLNHIKELLIIKKMTLKEAGEHIGILDENYLSRLFRKYVGVTAREFKLMQYRNASIHIKPENSPD